MEYIVIFSAEIMGDDYTLTVEAESKKKAIDMAIAEIKEDMKTWAESIDYSCICAYTIEEAEAESKKGIEKPGSTLEPLSIDRISIKDDTRGFFSASIKFDDCIYEISSFQKEYLSFYQYSSVIDSMALVWDRHIESGELNRMESALYDELREAIETEEAKRRIINDSRIEALIQLWEELYSPCIQVTRTAKGWKVRTTEQESLYSFEDVRELIRTIVADIETVSEDLADELSADAMGV